MIRLDSVITDTPLLKLALQFYTQLIKLREVRTFLCMGENLFGWLLKCTFYVVIVPVEWGKAENDEAMCMI